MTPTRHQMIRWAPRVVGIGLAAFLAMFAADVFLEDRGILGSLIAVGMHLVPSLVVLALVIVGWKYEGIAATGFLAMALFYTSISLAHPGWILLIAGPLVLVAVLFLLSRRAKTHESRSI